MLNTKLKAIFFDMDGTLIDSLPVLSGVYKKFLLEYGYLGREEEFKELNGHAITELIPILAERYQMNVDYEDLLACYMRLLSEMYAPYVEPLPWAVNLLKWLTRNSLQLALVTSTTRPLVNEIVARHRWGNYFSHIITGDDVLHSKPYPDIYQKTLTAFNLLPDEVIVIEDSLNGIQSGLDAGLQVVWKKSGSYSPILGAQANKGVVFTIETLEELVPFVQSTLCAPSLI